MATSDLIQAPKKSNELASFVEKRLREMSDLKSHRVQAVRAWAAEYRDSNLSPRSSKKSDFKSNAGFALVQTKASDFIASLPKFDFQPMSDESRSKVPMAKKAWDYWWRISEIEKELFEIVIDANVKGTGYGWVHLRNTSRTVKFPDGRGGWEEKEAKDVRPEIERVEWENAYINATEINKATECCFIRHWQRDEFLQARSKELKMSGLADKDIPYGKRYDWYSDMNGGVSYGAQGPAETGAWSWPNNEQRNRVVSEIHWYSKTQDRAVIVANGVEISDSPLPSLHKELPILILTDHWVEGDYTGRGEYDVTADARRLKDSAISLGIDITKASIGAMFISKDAEFEGGSIKFALDEFNEIGDVEGIKHFVPSVNVSYAQYVEGKADEYITAVSGVDFKGLLMGPSETASKTVAKVETQKRRIALMQRYAAWTFFSRLAKLLMGDLVLLHKSGKKTISVQGETVDENNVPSNVSNGGYGVFTIKPKDFPSDVNVLPNIESMAVDSAQERQDFLQAMQIYGSLAKEDGRPLVNPEFWLESGRSYFPAIDFDKATQKSELTKDPEVLMKEAGLSGDAIDPNAMPMPEGAPAPAMDPNFIPPAQRSGAKKAVSTPGSAPKVAASFQ